MLSGPRLSGRARATSRFESSCAFDYAGGALVPRGSSAAQGRFVISLRASGGDLRREIRTRFAGAPPYPLRMRPASINRQHRGRGQHRCRNGRVRRRVVRGPRAAENNQNTTKAVVSGPTSADDQTVGWTLLPAGTPTCRSGVACAARSAVHLAIQGASYLADVGVGSTVCWREHRQRELHAVG